MQNREAFLNHIANRLDRPRIRSRAPEKLWTKQPELHVYKDYSKEELIKILKEQCDFIHTTFKRVRTDTLTDALTEVITMYGGGPIITAKDYRNNLYGLSEFFKTINDDGTELHEWDPRMGKENVEFAERSNIGITFSDVTLAESGTITLLNDHNNSRSISLLPTHYIAIIPKETIVPRLSYATQKIHVDHMSGKKVPSCVSFITGPSNSADIELKLVVGVHGPVKATYIIVD